MNPLTYNAQFFLDKEKGKEDARVRFRIKWDKNTVAFGLGYRVEIAKWSTATQRCKINTTHGKKKIPANIINKKIQDYINACDKVFRNFQLKNTVPSKDKFKDSFNIEIGRPQQIKPDSSSDFFEIFDRFVLEESILKQWTTSTTKKVRSAKKHFEKFDRNLQFEDLTEENLNKYQHFLQFQLKFRNSTIKKSFSILKWFMKWAEKNGYHKSLAYQTFRPKLKTIPKKIIFLTTAEIKKIQKCFLIGDYSYLEKVRDIFLFQCFTGLRYSDVENLKRSNIKEGYIEIITVKTNDNLIIELNKHSSAILEKYKHEEFPNNRVLPVVSNQKMNDYIKILGEIAGINDEVREVYYQGNRKVDVVTPKWALLSTHAGRRTFICNGLSLGIPPQVIMKWTGHTDYKSMKPYIDIADEIKSNAMEKFNLL